MRIARWTPEEAERLLPQIEEAQLAGWRNHSFRQRISRRSPILHPVRGSPAAGENACTAVEFARMLQSRAVTYPRALGDEGWGVSTEFSAVLKQAEAAGRPACRLPLHFGPGYWATLQLLAVALGQPLLERLYVEPNAMRGVDTPLPDRGTTVIPALPGIGFSA